MSDGSVAVSKNSWRRCVEKETVRGSPHSMTMTCIIIQRANEACWVSEKLATPPVSIFSITGFARSSIRLIHPLLHALQTRLILKLVGGPCLRACVIAPLAFQYILEFLPMISGMRPLSQSGQTCCLLIPPPPQKMQTPGGFRFRRFGFFVISETFGCGAGSVCRGA